MSAPTAASEPTGWWLAYPGLLQTELAALAAAGATWADGSRIDPAAGLVAELDPRSTLRICWPHPAPAPGDPDPLLLLVRYPEAYPWLPPRVRLPEPLPDLHHHRHPVDGSLCLLASDDDWHPGGTLASLLAAQLPRLLTAGRSTNADPATLALEAGAEPAWTHLARPSLGGLLVDSACLPPSEVPGGLADLIFVGTSINPVHALVAVLGADHRVLWSTDVFGLREAERVPWVRVPTLPAGPLQAAELWRTAVARVAEVLHADTGARQQPLLALVGSEGAGRRPCEEFLLLTRPAPAAERGVAVGAHEPEPTDPLATAVPVSADQLTLFSPEPDAPAGTAHAGGQVRVRRSWSFGRADLAARLPGEHGEKLAAASVTVVGVGAVGGPIALELARAGVGQLHLVDGDVHDPATSSRQLLGVRHAGDLKVLGIAGRILGANPHTLVTIDPRHLGSDGGTALSQLRSNDLVIDATATLSVPRYLAAHLRLTGTPLLVAAATAGGWGGTIVSFPADGGGCWECLQLHRSDRRSLPWPPARPDGQLLPVSCSHPTYLGGYPELGHVALQAARTALALLTRQDAAGARSRFGDLQVLTLQRRSGPVNPRWQARQLPVHPDCPLHEPAAGERAARARPRQARSAGRV